MSRVERTETPGARRESEQRRESQEGRTNIEREAPVSPGSTPGKAEGEERDVDEALRQRD